MISLNRAGSVDFAQTKPTFVRHADFTELSAAKIVLQLQKTEDAMNRYLLASFMIAAFGSTAAFGAAPPANVYVAKAGASDLFKRQSGALMAKSTNPSVRSFAAMMIKDHAASTADIRAAATKAKTKVAPPALEPMQAKNLAALRASTGTARDKLYIEQQKAAHAAALSLQQGYAQEGDVPALRAVAAKIVPVVQHHKMMIDAM